MNKLLSLCADIDCMCPRRGCLSDTSRHLQMEPDRLLTDRAAYVTYLEAQLDRVTTALLTSQANGDSSSGNDSRLPARQKASGFLFLQPR